MRRRKPLAPSTLATYRSNLERAFGPEPYTGKAKLQEWSPTSLRILRAAALRLAPHRVDDIPEGEYEVARLPKGPTEAELKAIETAAEALPPALRAMALLPLGLGLRAAEAINLQRTNVENAVEGESLLVLRKGGREQLLPADGVRPLLDDLLDDTKWQTSWQILSSTSERAAYRTLYRLVKTLGTSAGVKNMRPHKLRHGFASRMERAGASLPQIQKMMDHQSPLMTSRYVHPENQHIVKFLQKMKGAKKWTRQSSTSSRPTPR